MANEKRHGMYVEYVEHLVRVDLYCSIAIHSGWTRQKGIQKGPKATKEFLTCLLPTMRSATSIPGRPPRTRRCG